MTKESAGTGEALDASVSNAPNDGVARTKLLELAETLEGAARDTILALAAQIITPAEYLENLAQEAEDAAALIKEKIKGMEATLQSKLDEAKSHREAAQDQEN